MFFVIHWIKLDKWEKLLSQMKNKNNSDFENTTKSGTNYI